MEKQLLKISSFLTLIAFCSTQFQTLPEAQAAPEVKLPIQSQLTLSPDLGTIEELKTGNGPTLIHLQTAHGNFEAQKNIQGILHSLRDLYGIQTVFVEGSSFKLRPKFLRLYPEDMKRTMSIADQLAKRALVKGPGLFLLEAKDAEGYGIENPDVYRENLEAFKEVLLHENHAKNFMRAMDVQITRLTSPYLNKDLRTFLEQLNNFESQKIQVADWFSFLRAQTMKHFQADLSDAGQQLEWPMFVRLFKLMEIESKLKLNEYAAEKPEFLKAIGRFLRGRKAQTYKEVEKLLNEPMTRHQLLDPETSYLFEDMVSGLPRNFNYSKFPNVKLFIGQLLLQSELKATALMAESEKLSDLISRRLAATQEQRKLLELLKDYRLLQKLFRLELTPVDYEKISARVHQALPSELGKRFLALNKKQRVKNTRFDGLPEMDLLFKQALEFYRLAKKRDEIMAANVERKMKELKIDKAAVVTGGFHSRPFSDYFARRDYRYALITPKITTTEGRNAYVESILHTGITKSTLETLEFMGSLTDMKRQGAVVGDFNNFKVNLEQIDSPFAAETWHAMAKSELRSSKAEPEKPQPVEAPGISEYKLDAFQNFKGFILSSKTSFDEKTDLGTGFYVKLSGVLVVLVKTEKAVVFSEKKDSGSEMLQLKIPEKGKIELANGEQKYPAQIDSGSVIGFGYDTTAKKIILFVKSNEDKAAIEKLIESTPIPFKHLRVAQSRSELRVKYSELSVDKALLVPEVSGAPFEIVTATAFSRHKDYKHFGYPDRDRIDTVTYNTRSRSNAFLEGDADQAVAYVDRLLEFANNFAVERSKWLAQKDTTLMEKRDIRTWTYVILHDSQDDYFRSLLRKLALQYAEGLNVEEGQEHAYREVNSKDDLGRKIWVLMTYLNYGYGSAKGGQKKGNFPKTAYIDEAGALFVAQAARRDDVLVGSIPNPGIYRFLHAMGQGIVNLVELRTPFPDQRILLTRVVSDYDRENLTLQDSRQARAAMLVWSIWVGIWDLHFYNLLEAQGVPMTFDLAGAVDSWRKVSDKDFWEDFVEGVVSAVHYIPAPETLKYLQLQNYDLPAVRATIEKISKVNVGEIQRGLDYTVSDISAYREKTQDNSWWLWNITAQVLNRLTGSRFTAESLMNSSRSETPSSGPSSTERQPVERSEVRTQQGSPYLPVEMRGKPPFKLEDLVAWYRANRRSEELFWRQLEKLFKLSEYLDNLLREESWNRLSADKVIQEVFQALYELKKKYESAVFSQGYISFDGFLHLEEILEPTSRHSQFLRVIQIMSEQLDRGEWRQEYSLRSAEINWPLQRQMRRDFREGAWALHVLNPSGKPPLPADVKASFAGPITAQSAVQTVFNGTVLELKSSVNSDFSPLQAPDFKGRAIIHQSVLERFTERALGGILFQTLMENTSAASAPLLATFLAPGVSQKAFLEQLIHKIRNEKSDVLDKAKLIAWISSGKAIELIETPEGADRSEIERRYIEANRDLVIFSDEINGDLKHGVQFDVRGARNEDTQLVAALVLLLLPLAVNADRLKQYVAQNLDSVQPRGVGFGIAITRLAIDMRNLKLLAAQA